MQLSKEKQGVEPAVRHENFGIDPRLVEAVRKEIEGYDGEVLTAQANLLSPPKSRQMKEAKLLADHIKNMSVQVTTYRQLLAQEARRRAPNRRDKRAAYAQERSKQRPETRRLLGDMTRAAVREETTVAEIEAENMGLSQQEMEDWYAKHFDEEAEAA